MLVLAMREEVSDTEVVDKVETLPRTSFVTSVDVRAT
jgi:hypothetical protein